MTKEEINENFDSAATKLLEALMKSDLEHYRATWTFNDCVYGVEFWKPELKFMNYKHRTFVFTPGKDFPVEMELKMTFLIKFQEIWKGYMDIVKKRDQDLDAFAL